MIIEHVAIWVSDLETMREFYEKYFGGVSNNKYINPAKGYQSYFLKFSKGCRLELMHKTGVKSRQNTDLEYPGFTHLAFSSGSKENVEALTNKLLNDGFAVIQAPRHTGDGYYESVILDPEGNRIEITE